MQAPYATPISVAAFRLLKRPLLVISSASIGVAKLQLAVAGKNLHDHRSYKPSPYCAF